jgi:hypothetical protein
MLVTLLGMMTLVREQPKNVLSLMLVTLLEIATLVKLEQ